MENKILKETIKKSKLNARDHFDYERLIYDVPGLLVCTYEEDFEEITFCYDVAGVKPAVEILNEKEENKYRFLINLALLRRIFDNYKISLSPDNLYYDDNFMPRIKSRDLYSGVVKNRKEEFLFMYKTYIGGILSGEYSVTQLQESGLSVLKKNTVFAAFMEEQEVSNIVEELRNRKEKFQKRERATTKRVKKIPNLCKTVLAVAATVLFIASAVTLGYELLQVKPVMTSLIAANQAYTAKNYVDCIDHLKQLGVDEMDLSTKYILAASYARSESLKKEEIAAIVDAMTLTSPVKELEYWIYLGRLDEVKAGDIAKSLSDDRLLMYAYMKELTRLETDTSIAGEEKEARISVLEQNIDKLGKKYTDLSED